MQRLRWIGTITLLLAAAACADRVTAPAVATGAPNFIIGGTPTGTGFGAVGAPMLDFAGDGLDPDDWFCTGSLISPTVFLTAAHCLDFFPAGTQLYVTFRPSTAEVPKYAIAATGYQADPLYGFNQNDPHDIGVIFLPATKTKGITPLTLPPAGYLDALNQKNGLNNTIFLNVGYGGDGQHTGKPVITYSGIRKISRSPFQNLEPAWLLLNMNSSATGLGGDCYGDSGGPKFIEGNTSMVVATVITGDFACRATSKDYRLDTPNARTFLSHYVKLP